MTLEDFGLEMETNNKASWYGLYPIHEWKFVEYVADMYGVSDNWGKRAIDAALQSVYYDPKAGECVVSTKRYDHDKSKFVLIRCNADNLGKVSGLTGIPTREQMDMANGAIKKIFAS